MKTVTYGDLVKMFQQGWTVDNVASIEEGLLVTLQRRERLVPVWATITLCVLTLGLGWPILSLVKRTKRQTVLVPVGPPTAAQGELLATNLARK